MASTKLSSCVGFETIIDDSGAVQTPTIPHDASWAIISIEPVGTDMRWRDDGTDPTTAVGHMLASPNGAGVYTQPLIYRGDLDKLRFIRNGGAGSATVHLSCYTGG